MDLERPVVRVIVGKMLPDGSCCLAGHGRVLTLQDAADYAPFGWDVLTDPFDREELVRYEAIERAVRRYWHT